MHSPMEMHTRTCVYKECRDGDAVSHIVKAGFFLRADDHKRVQRYLCRNCGRLFSAATKHDTFRQKKRRINGLVRKLLCEKNSLNAIARILRIHRKTVASRLDFFGRRARKYFDETKVINVSFVQFDEMQSSIHTKRKPVAIPMAVCGFTRRILALTVVSMPAQHPLINEAQLRDGPRADDRPAGVAYVLERIKPMLTERPILRSDSALHYPAAVARILPDAVHERVLSRRPIPHGNGELKEGFDPIFAFDHTAAMVRDCVSRLVRKTWGTSKRMDRLETHLLVYAHHHNLHRIPQ